MKSESTLLHYPKPARAWTQALPVGNGTLGAMIFGGLDRERLALNHDELWTGFPQDRSRTGSYVHFPKARQLALDGKLNEAQDLLEKEWLATRTQAYMPLGDLIINFEKPGKPESYRRSLDLTTATALTEYRINDTVFKREVIASFPHKTIAIHLSAKGKEKLNFKIRLNSKLKSKVYVKDDILWLEGECPSEFNSGGIDHNMVYNDKDELRGIQFLSGVRVICNGTVTFDKASISVNGAKEAAIYFCAETSFNGWQNQPFINGKEFKKTCKSRLENLGDYKEIRAAHIEDYRSYFDRVEIDLGSDNRSDTPTDKRLKAFEKKKNDRGLYSLLYNYGRYLAIAGSREGSQPLNLQGIWNEKIVPPWNSNYTVNINTEMNYWPMLPCNMPELHLPLIEMIKDISISGISTAKEHYDAPGFVCHHNIDLWRHTVPVSGQAVYAFWPMASGWLCRHLFEHYEYMRDEEFLRDTAYPIMKSAAEFYLFYLVEDKNGALIAAPSTSPENTFTYRGKSCSVSQTSTMTMAIIKDLFISCIRSAEILDFDHDFAALLKQKLELMLPFQIGNKGQLLEWYEEHEEREPHHRHVSHLYALHPARLINTEDTPELTEACRKTLELRGDDGTGWSLGWKINFWARLRDGDRALTLLEKQLRFVRSCSFNYMGGGGTYANLFDAHPPFQIDGNFGAVSGINEMLMQSDGENIWLLPALPSKWQKGHINGLLAKGGILVDIKWKNGKLTAYSLKGKGRVKVVWGDYRAEHKLDGNKLDVDVK